MKRILLLAGMLGIAQLSLAQVALSENFEAATFPPTGWTLANTHPTKNWIRIANADAVSGTGSAAVNWDVAAQDESLISPSFSLVGYTTAYFNFTAVVGYEYMVDPNANGDLFAKISTDGGTTWTTVWVEEDEGVFEDYTPLLKRINISSYAGQANVKVKFQYVATDADLVKIDDVSVTACPAYEGTLTIASLTDTTVSFESDMATAEYNVEYGAIGFTQGTGTELASEGGAFDLASLTPGTGYQFYIQTVCGSSSEGAWEGPFTFYTTLSTPTTVPYSYGFESGSLGAGGWTTLTVNANGGAWGIYTGIPQAGTSMGALVGGAQASDAWLFSRGMYLVGGTDVTISYYIRKAALAGNGGVNNLQVSIGLDNTPEAQFATLATFDDYAATTYTLQTHTFAVPETGIYHLGFYSDTPAHTAANQGGILLDGLTVTGETFGTNNALASQFSVFPNPTTGVINIANADNALVNGVEIVDINGRTVKTVKFDNVSSAQINVSDLASGMYLMNISSDKGTTTKKIVKN